MIKLSAMKTFNVCVRQFSKQVVVVTGCDSGLGFSLAQRCLQEGVSVIATCLQPEGPGGQDLARNGAHVQNLDVTDDENVGNVAAFTAEFLSKRDYQLQAVVNNAGVMVFGEFEWQTPKLVKQQVSVNLLGAFNVARNFLPLLQRDQARLVNIASHCALAGLPALSVYGATKAALLNWNDTLRIEQAKYGVKVVSFIPGSFFGESGILSRQSQYAEEMLNGMTEEVNAKHRTYFNRVQQYLQQLRSPSVPKVLADEILHKKLLDAVFSENPRPFYKHEPNRYSIYHTLFKITPVWLRDRLVQRFVMLPKYKI